MSTTARQNLKHFREEAGWGKHHARHNMQHLMPTLLKLPKRNLIRISFAKHIHTLYKNIQLNNDTNL